MGIDGYPPRPAPGKCGPQAFLLVALAPIAIPYLVARTHWLRKKGLIK